MATKAQNAKARFDQEVPYWLSANKVPGIIGVEREKRFIAAQREVLNVVSQNPKAKILEIGCGAGANISQFASQFPTATFVGVDISPKMIAMCKKQWSKQKNLSFKVHNISKTSINGKFDLIILLGVVGYFDNNNTAFKNIDKSLENGGHLAFTYGSKYSLFNGIRKLPSTILDSSKVLVLVYNKVKKLANKNAIEYNPKANDFKQYSSTQIAKSLPANSYSLKLTRNFCFAAGIIPYIWQAKNAVLSILFEKWDPLHLALTRFVVFQKK